MFLRLAPTIGVAQIRREDFFLKPSLNSPVVRRCTLSEPTGGEIRVLGQPDQGTGISMILGLDYMTGRECF